MVSFFSFFDIFDYITFVYNLAFVPSPFTITGNIITTLQQYNYKEKSVIYYFPKVDNPELKESNYVLSKMHVPL